MVGCISRIFTSKSVGLQSKLNCPLDIWHLMRLPSSFRKKVYSAVTNTHFQKEQGQAAIVCPQLQATLKKRPPVFSKLTPQIPVRTNYLSKRRAQGIGGQVWCVPLLLHICCFVSSADLWFSLPQCQINCIWPLFPEHHVRKAPLRHLSPVCCSGVRQKLGTYSPTVVANPTVSQLQRSLLPDHWKSHRSLQFEWLMSTQVTQNSWWAL